MLMKALATWSEILLSAASLTLAAGVCRSEPAVEPARVSTTTNAIPLSATSPLPERRFRAKQVFTGSGPILYQSNFADRGFDLLSLSEDGRYNLASPNPERLALVDAPGGKAGEKAVRFVVPRAPNSYRAEISLPHEPGFQERWYGVRQYVPADWKPDPGPGADIVVQWHAIPGNGKATYPNLEICILDSTWEVRQSFGAANAGPTRKRHVLADPLQPGQWVEWIVRAKWSPGPDGRLRVWKDAKEQLSLNGPNVYGNIGLEYTPYLKTGIYHPEWNLSTPEREKGFPRQSPGVARKEILVSKLVVANAEATYEDVAAALRGAAGGE